MRNVIETEIVAPIPISPSRNTFCLFVLFTFLQDQTGMEGDKGRSQTVPIVVLVSEFYINLVNCILAQHQQKNVIP